MGGTVLSVSGRRWLAVWVGLELNLFAFLPLLGERKKRPSAERAGKYFFAQVMGSLLFLAGAAVPVRVAGGFLFIGLLVKVGSAPVYQ